jgi:hypothetical protein
VTRDIRPLTAQDRVWPTADIGMQQATESIPQLTLSSCMQCAYSVQIDRRR